MSFRQKWSDELKAAIVADALQGGRNAVQVHARVVAGKLPGQPAVAMPLGTVRYIIGQARSELEVREQAGAGPMAALEVIAERLQVCAARQEKLYRNRLARGKAKPGELAAVARDVREVVALVKALERPAPTGTARPARRDDGDDFIGGLAAVK